jgi:hypothetical protein
VKLVVFLSTGRCGTQFFTKYLHRASGGRARGRAVVVHEPIASHYAPKQTLRADLDEALPRHELVRRHFDEIARITDEGRLYVETGWPVFPWIPWLLRRYGDEALVVHLTRNPVRFAYSMASHGFYPPDGAEHPFTHTAMLHPGDPGVRHRDYRPSWDELNPVEKCLFLWLEVNTWAEELKSAQPEKFVAFRSEDVLPRPATLLDGMIKRRPELADVFRDRPPPPPVTDIFQNRIGFEVDSLRYPPEVAQLAAHYGYAMDSDEVAIARRFFEEPS